MSRVLVTGANGFVGQHLVPHLEQGGHRVIKAMRQHSNPDVSTVLVGDIGPDTDWSHALVDCDIVVHLAARVHVMHETEEDSMTAYRDVNTLGTKSLIEQAVEAGVNKFIYLSTIKVNGEATSGERFSEDVKVKPQDPYAISKYEAERVLMEMADLHDIDVYIIRPPLIYGPGVKANFYSLLRLVDMSLPMPFSGIRNARSLLYTGNLVDFIDTCLIAGSDTAGIYLLSDGHDLSTPELISEIGHALNKSVFLFYIPVAVLKIMLSLIGKSAVSSRLTGSLQVNIDKARDSLGWSPRYSVREGIQSTVDWYHSCRV